MHRRPKRVAHAMSFAATALTDQSAPTVSPGTRDIMFPGPKSVSAWQIAGIPDALLARWPDTACAFRSIPQTLAARPR
jgi:hypothetical protein